MLINLLIFFVTSNSYTVNAQKPLKEPQPIQPAQSAFLSYFGILERLSVRLLLVYENAERLRYK